MTTITVTELARVLHIRAPTAEQTVALQRVLDSADLEVTSCIDRIDPLTVQEQQLADEVTLERAVEHWQQEESPFGLLGLGGDNVPIYTARDSFQRHRKKLNPIRQLRGVA